MIDKDNLMFMMIYFYFKILTKIFFNLNLLNSNLTVNQYKL